MRVPKTLRRRAHQQKTKRGAAFCGPSTMVKKCLTQQQPSEITSLYNLRVVSPIPMDPRTPGYLRSSPNPAPPGEATKESSLLQRVFLGEKAGRVSNKHKRGRTGRQKRHGGDDHVQQRRHVETLSGGRSPTAAFQ